MPRRFSPSIISPATSPAVRKAERGRPRTDIRHRVEAVDAATGTVRLRPDKRPRQRAAEAGGADVAEAFTEVAQESRAGDRVQFSRNNRRADRNNGHIVTVRAIGVARASVVIEKLDGSEQMLDLSRFADRYLRHGWVRTIHFARGATADSVMAHFESFRANTVDAA